VKRPATWDVTSPGLAKIYQCFGKTAASIFGVDRHIDFPEDGENRFLKECGSLYHTTRCHIPKAVFFIILLILLNFGSR
jgi:hypothetical protein